MRGSGDGGVYLTAGDIDAFWAALRSGQLLGADLVERMTSVSQSADGHHYGWGVWLDADGTAWSMEGMDAGVSFRSTHVPSRELTATVLSNTTRGAWPVVRRLGELLAD